MIDGVIGAAVVLTALLGWREGLVRALWGYAGLMVGAMVGIVLVPVVFARSDLSTWVSVAALAVVGVAALAVRFVSVWTERRLRARVAWSPRPRIDRPGGAVFGAVAALGVSWMIGLALAGSTLPTLSGAANRSTILRVATDAHLPLSTFLVQRFERLGEDRGFPRYIDVFVAEDVVDVPAPPADVARDPDVRRASASVLRIHAPVGGLVADQGTGFVVAPGRLMTVAHVVAESDDPVVQVGDDWLPATVLYCDPEQDVAVLDVPGLDVAALELGDASDRDPAVVVGYPADGPLTLGPARIRERQVWQSADVFGDGRYEHDGFSVRATVRGGNSGGPLVALDGRVVGVVVASSRADLETGYALSTDQVAEATRAARSTTPTSATSCG